MSDDRAVKRISALDALGREFDRAMYSPPRRARITSALPLRVALPVVGAIAMVAVGLSSAGAAIAEKFGELVGLAEERAALEEFCGDETTCTIINGFAKPGSDDSVQIVGPGQALATEGRPASDCPQATSAYAELGVDVDAYVGPCPDQQSISSAPGQVRPGEVPAPPGGEGGDQQGD